MTDFFGWDMPLQYSSIIEEHTAVRTKSGLFDLSHMGRIYFDGKDAEVFLNEMLTQDVPKMKSGQAKYGFALNEDGGIIDDLILYKEDTRYLLVVNASNREKVLKQLAKFSPKYKITISDNTFESALIALQGKTSQFEVKRILGLELSDLKYYKFISTKILNADVLISRTGYTGEDGFEFFVPKEKANALWNEILIKGKETGIMPVGLGARDTLRLEAAMPLYGHELSDGTIPQEAGLNFAVAMEKKSFVGKKALQEKLKLGIKRKLKGFETLSKRIARQGHEIIYNGKKVGLVTSGTFSPTLQKPVGMCMIDASLSDDSGFEADIRGHLEKIKIVSLPFYHTKKKN